MGLKHLMCCCGGVWDFFGWCTDMDEAEAVAGRILVRVPSSFETGADTDSHPEWSVDIADFNGPTGNVGVWITHGITDPNNAKDQRVWYFLTKGTAFLTNDGDSRIEVVDYDFDGAPTSVATYTVDWAQTFSTPTYPAFTPLHPGPRSEPRTYEISWDSMARPSANASSPTPGYQAVLFAGQSDAAPQRDLDLSDLSITLWNESIFAPVSPSLAEQAQCSDDRHVYFSGDYRPTAVARINADQAIGCRLTVITSDVTYEWNGTFWVALNSPALSSYELKIVWGDLTVVAEDSAVADDHVLYTLTGKSSAGGSGVFVNYEVEAVACRSFEVVDGDPVGIFVYADDCLVSLRPSPTTFPGSPTVGQQHTGQSYLIDWASTDGTSSDPVAGSVSRIDILLPDGSIEDSGITSLTSDDAPRTIRHALASSGGSNGNFFMVTGNFGSQNLASDGKLKYMSDATTAIWTKTFSNIYYDIAVSDRFVYVIADKGTGDGLQGYAYDYTGTEYHLQYPNSPFRPLPPPVQVSPSFQPHDYYIEAWAVCRYADAIYPTAEYFSGLE